MSRLNMLRWLLMFSLIVGLLFGGSKSMMAAEVPKSERRIIVNYDPGSLWFPARQDRGSAKATQKILEDIVDEHAKAKVDTLVHCIFEMGWGCVPTSVTDLVESLWGVKRRPPRLDEAGIDFVEILLERCHQHNVEFIAGLRMNDRHNGGDMSCKGRFVREHPEWHLKGALGGLDYTYDGVRAGILTFIKEVLAAYEVDGVEFDYMRQCHMFEPGEGREKAHLLTDFTRKARQLLDAAAQRRGRSRLLLGVRVPQTLEECDYLGFDVTTWIKDGLVDYVVASDFFYTDFNAKTEDFVKLTEATDCKIYPAISPVITWGNEHHLLRPEHYRAAAQNFYAFGAQGISPYNYQYHWQSMISPSYPGPIYMWPAALGYLRELRDPQTAAQGDRHYLFHPLWEKGAPTVGVKDDRIVLDRAESAPQGSQRFRVAEDLSDPKLRAILQFKAVGIAEDENLGIQINGTVVPDSYVTRVFDPDGQNEWQGRELPAFYLYVIDLPRGMRDPLISNGDNQLTVRLIPTEGENEGTVTIDELEVYVHVTR